MSFHFLTSIHLIAFFNSGLPPNGNWITRLVIRCRNLQKLFLAAARVVNDSDLSAIAQYCPNMKQLDLLGNNYLSSEGCMM